MTYWKQKIHLRLKSILLARETPMMFRTKCSPANADTLGLRLSPIIYALKRKQICPALNQDSFSHASKASDEDVDPLQEHCTFKESMKSPVKENFVSAMVKEINNHASCENWKNCRKSGAPVPNILRSTWAFYVKRNRSTGDTIKFNARFCADGSAQELGIKFNEAHCPLVK